MLRPSGSPSAASAASSTGRRQAEQSQLGRPVASVVTAGPRSTRGPYGLDQAVEVGRGDEGQVGREQDDDVRRLRQVREPRCDGCHRAAAGRVLHQHRYAVRHVIRSSDDEHGARSRRVEHPHDHRSTPDLERGLVAAHPSRSATGEHEDAHGIRQDGWARLHGGSLARWAHGTGDGAAQGHDDRPRDDQRWLCCYVPSTSFSSGLVGDRHLARPRSPASCSCRSSGCDYYALTLLVINAYAAAMLGGLTSLPLTFVGAMGLGILQSFAVGYLPTDGELAGLRAVVPALFLFAVIVLMPQAPAADRPGQGHRLRAAAVVAPGRSAGAARWCCSSVLLAARLSEANLLLVGTAATYAHGDAVAGAAHRLRRPRLARAVHLRRRRRARLRQARLARTSSACSLAALVAAAVGALVALPVLRLTGLYLALSTLAFGAAHGQAGLPGRLRLRLQRPAHGRRGSRSWA